MYRVNLEKKIVIFDGKFSIFSKSPHMYSVNVKKQNSYNGNWDVLRWKRQMARSQTCDTSPGRQIIPFEEKTSQQFHTYFETVQIMINLTLKSVPTQNYDLEGH